MAKRRAKKADESGSSISVPNETSEERARREDAEEIAKELIEDQEAVLDDEEVIKKRVDESTEDRDKRRMQHISDERMLADVGRVREIADSMARNEVEYLNKLDNATRRLKGLAGNPHPIVKDAVQSVAKRFDITVSDKGMEQPETPYPPTHRFYPFYREVDKDEAEPK